ncbi:angiopoietin-related protein 7-like [Palaemon carinicauda]|uniref:angiopoietin-related protein 7-like n=1 Tax=Palaemon carinicauda TaxID=392227 RepID=UPI0035B61AE5
MFPLGSLVFLIHLTSVICDDYDATPMEDPLEPVWKRMNSLSEDVLTGFKNQMEAFLREAEGNIDSKFHNLMMEVNNTGLVISAGAGSNPDPNRQVNLVKDGVTAWIENFYRDTIRKENDAAIEKASGRILVKLDALENKLIEHINVKINALAGAGAGPGSNASGDGGALALPAGTSVGDVEAAIMNHITSKLTDIENSITNHLIELASSLSTSQAKLDNIQKHLSKIAEEISDAGLSSPSGTSTGGSESCVLLVNKVTELVNGSQLTTDFLEQQETRWKEMQSVIAEVRDTPSYLPRDCSDIHWHHHEAVSGVYQIYPSLDRKNSISVWCDMGENKELSDGGWTVILRRRETDFGHEDFNRTWQEYAAGFGDPAEGEWWFSLTALHSLTYRQPYSIQFVLTDIELGTFYAEYDSFRVEDEAHLFRLIVDGFSGNVTNDAFKGKHHGMPFSTPDVDNDNYDKGSCAVSNNGGWWYNACYYTTLTSPFPTSADRDAKTIRWVHDPSWLVLKDVTVKIRPAGYGQRFDKHSTE